MAGTNVKYFKSSFDADTEIKYFTDFLSDQNNKRLISLLRIVLAELDTGVARTGVFFVRLNGSNADSYASFRKATFEAEVQRHDDGYIVAAPFCVFFVGGYGILIDFMDKKDPRVPECKLQRQALYNLLQFLANNKEPSILTEDREDKLESEGALSVRVAQHFLVPLAPHKNFIIDAQYADLQIEESCEDDHSVNVGKGDTSFGCHRGWHGRADILMGDEIPINVFEVSGESDDDPETFSVSSGSSSVEEKKGDHFTADNILQITAQTMVYSFVQRKKNPKSSNTLVPGIGISEKKIMITLYDCVEDILVTTGPVDLQAQFGNCKFNLRAIIMLWLVLNHGLFGNKTPDKYNIYKSEFHSLLAPKQLKAYRNESEQPFKAKLDQGSLFKFVKDLNLETIDPRDDAFDYVSERQTLSLK